MNLTRLADQLAAVRARAEWLSGRAAQDARLPAGWLSQAIAELSAAIGVLQQSEQELRAEIDELHRSRAAAEVDRQRYQSLFEFAPDGYLVTGPGGDIQEANWAAGILLNAPEDTLIGRSLAQFVVPEEAAAFGERLDGLDQVDGVREWETCLQPRDYGSFHASLTVAPARRADGQVMALRWLVRDITARKQAVEQVQALNAELEQRVLERTAQLRAANRQLQAEIEDRRRAEAALRARARQQAVVAGLGQQALAGVDLATLLQVAVTLVARTLEVEFCRVVELAPSGHGLIVRASFGWPAGEAPQVLPPGADPQAEFTLQAQAPVITPDLAHEPRFPTPADCVALAVVGGLSVAVPGRDSQPWGVLAAHTRREQAFAADDTNFLVAVANVLSAAIERQRTEAEVRALNAGLERRVVERTTELEAKNRELETFTYSVSHDLKAPLRGIDGYSRLLLDDYGPRLDADGQDSLRTIRRAVQQMNQLIDDLLAYSRLERRSLVSHPVDLAALVHEVVAERRDEWLRRGVILTIDVTCSTVSADREGLAVALRNLLDNALKFTHDQPDPRIEIGGRAQPAACLLWVRDNGIGFDMQYAERIFGLFQRLHRPEAIEGTGIGLAIVHKAMERMRGRAWAEGAPGQGACFYLEIPR